jgi:hypothetical protein
VTDLAATFLRSLREALSRVALQPDATVVSQVSADYVRVELRQGDLVLAAGTVHRAGVRATTRQTELPFEAPATTRQTELPAPAPVAPPADDGELVELVMDDDTSGFEGLDLFDSTRVIAWTWSGKRARDEYLRTIVPRPIADELLRRSKGRIDAERVSIAKGLPSHVLTIGGDVETEEAGPRKILGVVGVSEGTEGAPGLVVEMPDGPRVAWVDALDLKDGAVVAYPSLAYIVEFAHSRWTARRHNEPPPKPLPTMKPKKPAPKPRPSAVAKAVEASEAESHRAQKHDCDAAKLRHPGVPCVAWLVDGTVQTATRPKGTTEAAWVAQVRELAPQHGVVRVYSRKGECTWDSRDGGK